MPTTAFEVSPDQVQGTRLSALSLLWRVPVGLIGIALFLALAAILDFWTLVDRSQRHPRCDTNS